MSSTTHLKYLHAFAQILYISHLYSIFRLFFPPLMRCRDILRHIKYKYNHFVQEKISQGKKNIPNADRDDLYEGPVSMLERIFYLFL